MNGGGRRTISERIIVAFLAFSIAFFPLVPLVAIADDGTGGAEETIGKYHGEEESEEEEEGSVGETKAADSEEEADDGEDSDPEEDDDAGPEGSIVGPLSFPGEDGEETDEEPEADIVNENEVVLENEVVADSGTGGNGIGTVEEEPKTETNGTEPSENGCEGDMSEADDTDEAPCAPPADGDDDTDPSVVSGSDDEPLSSEDGETDETSEVPGAGCGDDPDTEGECGVPESVIDTGDTVADATLVTDVNVNIVGEGIEKEVVELSGHTEGDVNLLEDFLSVGSEEEEENEGEHEDDEREAEGGTDGLSVSDTNVAEVTNDVSATATTGDNAITGAEGDAAITTGDALAMAALVNLVNVNLVGEDGLFSVINNFGEWIGDIILPGNGLLSLSGDGSPFRTVENSNTLELTETVSASAATGGNLAEGGEGDATITTGDALAVARSETLANMNFVGDAWLYFLLNNFGTWVGQVIDGEEVIGDSFSYALGDGSDMAEGSGDGECAEADCADIVSISNGNTAVIRNAVVATAGTGGNTVSDAGGDATIATGDATAVANVFNMANVNIVGSDWLFGVFNNFGTWRGNLVFAYPDLRVSIDDGADEAHPGDGLTYRVSVENVGKAEAENVAFSLDLPDGFRTAVSVPEIPDRLAPGEGFSFELSGSVASESLGTTLRATASASTATTEKHGENNSDSDETDIVLPDPVLTRVTDDSDDDDDGEFSIRREMFGSDRIEPGGTVGCRITLMNDGEAPLFDVEVEDTFSAPDGFEFDSYLWDIGYLAPDEGVIIEYVFQAGDTSSVGRYTAVARATGHESDDDKVKSRKAYAAFTVIPAAYAETLSEPAESLPEIVETAEAAPEILGVSEAAKREFPIFFLILSGLAYALIMNWSWIPNLRNESYGKE